MANFNPFKFMQEVRQETNKVTWPSRRETAITTAMVFLFAALAAVFFLFADQLIRLYVTTILTIQDVQTAVIYAAAHVVAIAGLLWAFNRAR
jgi:preprotein translocase subunit SecE